ncbi:MAG: DNA-binding response regulator [Phenylobacterium sp.]|uniref:response regulator transcription factor n=1 Tax=Phenylobacterium sp. TaxID=1871053 RepID=UPI0025EE2B0F|nr:response regulator transcription factor [Phenylobacterium sp.]MBA4010508.1 DNA-binding response regulator [Phenylobacterium sp.]
MSAASILIVEDEEQLQRMLRSALTQAGYMVVTAKSGLEALEQLVRNEFGVVLLDLGLPDMDGKEVIAQARSISRAPFLVVSARGSEREKIAALDLGANDYVAKPFDMGELMARIRVALRIPQPASASKAAAGGLHVDVAVRRATVDGASVRLSRKETELLALLMDARGEVVTHDAIIEAIWGRGTEADFMNVRVLAWQVRRKIEPDAAAPRFLIAEAGLGYRLSLD